MFNLDSLKVAGTSFATAGTATFIAEPTTLSGSAIADMLLKIIIPVITGLISGFIHGLFQKKNK